MQQTGQITIKLDAKILRSKEGASIQIGGIRRVTKMDDQRRTYYQETVIPAQVKATLIHTTDTDLEELRNSVGLVINFETDVGPNYMVRGAHYEEVGDLSNGEVQITFGGDPAEAIA